jgi:hypothetical protein
MSSPSTAPFLMTSLNDDDIHSVFISDDDEDMETVMEAAFESEPQPEPRRAPQRPLPPFVPEAPLAQAQPANWMAVDQEELAPESQMQPIAWMVGLMEAGEALIRMRAQQPQLGFGPQPERDQLHSDDDGDAEEQKYD